MNNSTSMHVDLQRRSPSQNMARFYGLSVEPDLFGVWVFTRNWGRIGSFGQSKCQSFDSSHDAYSALDRLYRKKMKRGYTQA